MTDDEKVRAEISAQVFDGAAAPAPAPETTEVKSPAPEVPKTVDAPVDEWAGVSPALRARFEQMQAGIGELDTLKFRLSQAENRVGSLTNELSSAKKAKKEEPKTPPPEHESVQKLRKDYPELTDTLEERIGALRAEILEQRPNIDEEALRKEVKETLKTELKLELDAERLDEAHPGWKESIETPEFKSWRATAKPEFQVPAKTYASAKKMLDAFTEFKKTQKSPADIEADRLKRLEQSQSVQGQKLPTQKSEADMTPAELRAHIAAQVWKG